MSQIDEDEIGVPYTAEDALAENVDRIRTYHQNGEAYLSTSQQIMVDLAHTVRDSFVGNGGALRLTISPRALCDWALMASELSAMRGLADPICKALDIIVLNGKPKEDVDVVRELYTTWMKGGNKPNP